MRWILALLFFASLAFATARYQGWFDVAEPTPNAVEEAPSEPFIMTPSARVPVFESEPESAVAEPTGVEARWAELNLQAIEALEASEHAKAVELFERCYEANPDEDVFAANLAEALARFARAEYESDQENAIEKLARASELAPDREGLAALLARWRKVATTEEDFAEDLSEHFRLSYDGGRNDLLNFGYTQILAELESAYQEFGELFGVYPVEAGRSRINVVLYRRSEFDHVTGLGDWAGGVFDGTVRVPVEDFDREKQGLKRVLRHELVHAFVDVVGGRDVPGWLNEGLAQILEHPFLSDRGAAYSRARKRLEGKPLFSLEKLQGSLASWKDKDAISLAYSQSHAFTAYIERMYGDRVLYDMVSGCKDGKSCAETFRNQIGIELSVVLEDLETR